MADPMDDLAKSLSDMELEQRVRRYYSETDAYAGILAAQYRKLHHYYAPIGGDQWPEDMANRPGLIHVTHNIIAPVVEVEARVESRLPKLSLQANDSSNEEEQARAEMSEKLHMLWLENSGWEVWLNHLCKAKSIFGKSFLKPVWNARDKRPDVVVVEQPQNLRIGWGASDYTEMDWALYEFKLSPMEAKRRWPKLSIARKQSGGTGFDITVHADHADPLLTMTPSSSGGQPQWQNRTDMRTLSQYEGQQVGVWDFWYKEIDEDGENFTVHNAMFVEGTLVQGPTAYSYYPDIPYILVEHDHVPGSPDAVGDVEPLLDIQYEINRALSHWAQLVNDEVDPAWWSPVESIPGGVIPRPGEVLATGEGGEIHPFEKPVNTFPIQELLQELHQAVFMRSGLSEILFTRSPGAQTAGRALQIQIESVANRIDPRRTQLYAALRSLLIFWSEMAERKQLSIPAGDEEVSVREIVQGLRRWKFTAPEITPRDNLELITAVVNKLNAKIISLETAMDELGVDSPLEMQQVIMRERSNPRLFPAEVQAFVAVMAMLQQYAATAQQLGLGPVAGAEGTEGELQAAQQEATPQGFPNDNGEAPPQPATPAGGAPPPGAAPPNQTLIRSTPTGQAQVLQQARFTTGPGA